MQLLHGFSLLESPQRGITCWKKEFPCCIKSQGSIMRFAKQRRKVLRSEASCEWFFSGKRIGL